MARALTPTLPHSWSIDSWPPDVWPNSPVKGRWVVRAHRKHLTELRALTRVGRTIIILGAQYARFLEKQRNHVADFEIAPNKARQSRSSERAVQI